jgi:hypothetical protein
MTLGANLVLERRPLWEDGRRRRSAQFAHLRFGAAARGGGLGRILVFGQYAARQQVKGVVAYNGGIAPRLPQCPGRNPEGARARRCPG